MWKLAPTIIILIMIPAAAFAQTSGTIDVGGSVQWLQPVVISFVTAVIGTVGTWVLYVVKQYTGIKIEQAQADVYIRAAQNQAASLIADGFVVIRENGKVEVPNAMLAAAGNDLLKSIPDAAAHFRLSLDEAMKKIVDMIPQVPAAPVIIAATVPKPVR